MKKFGLKLMAAALIGVMALPIVGCSSDSVSSRNKSDKKNGDDLKIEVSGAESEEDTKVDPEKLEFKYDVSDFLRIEECEITLTYGNGNVVTHEIPQFTLVDKAVEAEINEKILTQCDSLDVKTALDNMIIVTIWYAYDYEDGEELYTQERYFINLDTGKSYTNRELLDMVGFEGQSIHDVCYNALISQSNYSSGSDMWPDIYEDPAWPDINDSSFFGMCKNGNLYFAVYSNEYSMDVYLPEYLPDQSEQSETIFWFGFQYTLDDNHYRTGISSFNHTEL